MIWTSPFRVSLHSNRLHVPGHLERSTVHYVSRAVSCFFSRMQTCGGKGSCITVFVIYRCLVQKLSILTQHPLLHTISEDQEFRRGLARSFSVRVSHEVALCRRPGLQPHEKSSESLTRPRGSTS